MHSFYHSYTPPFLGSYLRIWDHLGILCSSIYFTTFVIVQQIDQLYR